MEGMGRCTILCTARSTGLSIPQGPLVEEVPEAVLRNRSSWAQVKKECRCGEVGGRDPREQMFMYDADRAEQAIEVATKDCPSPDVIAAAEPQLSWASPQPLLQSWHGNETSG